MSVVIDLDQETAATQARYDRIASFYDAMEWFTERSSFQKWRQELWSRVPDGRVLEVGVGTGKNMRQVSQITDCLSNLRAGLGRGCGGMVKEVADPYTPGKGSSKLLQLFLDIHAKRTALQRHGGFAYLGLKDMLIGIANLPRETDHNIVENDAVLSWGVPQEAIHRMGSSNCSPAPRPGK